MFERIAAAAAVGDADVEQPELGGARRRASGLNAIWPPL